MSHVRSVVILTALAVWTSLSAADWVGLGPSGGIISCGAVSTGAPPVVYACVVPHMLRSLDGGANWTVMNGTLPAYVLHVVVDPTDADVVICATNEGCYRSNDGGQTWGQHDMGYLGGAGLAMNPRNPQTIYSAGYGSGPAGWMLYCGRSTNGGVTWTQQEVDSCGAPSEGAVTVDPIDTTIVYVGDVKRGAAGNQTGFYKSTDCGATWTRYDFAPSGTVLNALYVSPLDHNVIVAGDQLGVYRSTDAGLTWVQTGTSTNNYRIVCVPEAPNILFTSSTTAVFRSLDTGNTWVETGTLITGKITSTLMTPCGQPGTVYCGNFAGMFKSSDYGDHWQMINNGIPRTSMIPVVGADPNRRSLVRVQTSEDDIYFSTNAGYDWDPQLRNSDYGSVSGFAFDPVDSLRQWMLRGRG